MALDVRVTVSGKLFDGCVKRVHHFSKAEMLGEKGGSPGKGNAEGETPEYTESIFAIRSLSSRGLSSALRSDLRGSHCEGRAATAWTPLPP